MARLVRGFSSLNPELASNRIQHTMHNKTYTQCLKGQGTAVGQAVASQHGRQLGVNRRDLGLQRRLCACREVPHVVDVVHVLADEASLEEDQNQERCPCLEEMEGGQVKEQHAPCGTSLLPIGYG